MSNNLRIAFMGTPDFSVGALQALIESRHDVVCVYTQPPRPKGRGQQVQKSAVHECAETHDIDVRYPLNFKSADDVKAFEDLELDVAVVAAYGLILPESILNAPKYGCINIHASLLPRWRGAAPIQRAIMAGDDESGVTIMQMEKGLDTGPEISKEKVIIESDMTATQLHDELADCGAKMIVKVIDQLAEEEGLKSTPQSEEGVTYAHMLRKEEGLIDWSKDACDIDRQIRALNPWPGTWCHLPSGKRLKIKQATLVRQMQEGAVGSLNDQGLVICGDCFGIQLQEIQPENKKPMDVKAALNGGYISVGDILS